MVRVQASSLSLLQLRPGSLGFSSFLDSDERQRAGSHDRDRWKKWEVCHVNTDLI